MPVSKSIIANRRKWIKALRSSKYKQGFGALRKTINYQTTHCCLGVACEVFTKPEEFSEFLRNETTKWSCLVPDRVSELLGIASDELRGTLASRNDSYNSFAEIADMLEKNITLEDKDLFRALQLRNVETPRN